MPQPFRQNKTNNATQRDAASKKKQSGERGRTLEREVPRDGRKVGGAVCEGVVLSAGHRKDAMRLQQNKVQCVM